MQNNAPIFRIKSASPVDGVPVANWPRQYRIKLAIQRNSVSLSLPTRTDVMCDKLTDIAACTRGYQSPLDQKIRTYLCGGHHKTRYQTSPECVVFPQQYITSLLFLKWELQNRHREGTPLVPLLSEFNPFTKPTYLQTILSSPVSKDLPLKPASFDILPQKFSTSC
jgi:hypothetical protein